MPYYKGMRVNLLGLPTSIFGKGKRSRAKSRGRKRSFYNPVFSSPFKRSSPKNLIVMYDFPHNQNVARDWFRRHLVKFGYVMIQKSVWVGPSPLPKIFLAYLKQIKIENNFKTFKLAKPYDDRKNSKNKIL